VSQQNVEFVRRFIDHSDEAGESLLAEIDPDVVWVVDPPPLLAGTYHGHEGSAALGAVVFKLRNRRIVGYRACSRREEALEPVGPRE
jgi:ketosteroid isomerase-like protein